MNIKEALSFANEKLDDAGFENYFVESRELLGYILDKSKEWLMINFNYDIPEDKLKKFFELIGLRLHGEPLQYILGKQYFMGLEFIVNKNVLIPRADTEILVYEALKRLENIKNPKVMDMCTGSGCIAISLAKNVKNAEIFAADISSEAIEVARENSELNGTDVKFIKSDLFESVTEAQFDMIVSNPPYISEEEMKVLEKDVLNEPHLALYGGKDGLDFYRTISEKAVKFLKPSGFLIFEIGYLQEEGVKNILAELKYKNIKTVKDYSGNNRVIISQNSLGA